MICFSHFFLILLHTRKRVNTKTFFKLKVITKGRRYKNLKVTDWTVNWEGGLTPIPQTK